MQELYDAARRHVCSWVMFDGSCYSGNTVDAFKAANYTGTAECCTNPPHQHCPHAAYEADIAVSSADATSVSTNGGAGLDLSQFEDAIEEARDAHNNRIDRYIDLGDFNHSHTDEGYGASCP